MKTLEKDCKIEIPYRYDLSFGELQCLYKDSEDVFILISKCYKAGFARGKRCQKRMQKKYSITEEKE